MITGKGCTNRSLLISMLCVSNMRLRSLWSSFFCHFLFLLFSSCYHIFRSSSSCKAKTHVSTSNICLRLFFQMFCPHVKENCTSIWAGVKRFILILSRASLSHWQDIFYNVACQGEGRCDPQWRFETKRRIALRNKDQSIALNEYSRLRVYFLTLYQYLTQLWVAG